jgi:hypothetical protein
MLIGSHVSMKGKFSIYRNINKLVINGKLIKKLSEEVNPTTSARIPAVVLM